ncbi:PREDICTED: protein crossbronx homolog [Nicrophorus vespilloides]|uniref:Protein crossbronx homolog n=1 Tax=Nicrophorus vespilloides TaxID=110193 RepID=A0ABM1MQU9_NICVS|nr:PREDICTED: protein crossbronx homolog [Nicrophorus vespilloides]
MQQTSRDSKLDSADSFKRQGSIRKVLHNKENIFGKQNEDLNKFYKTFLQEYSIIAEYKMIQSENIEGVYVIPSKESSLLWFGVIFVRSGLYENGVFRFNIELDENFPDGKHPKVFFQSDMFHPLVDEKTKELILLGGFPVWSKSNQHIWQVLKYIHWILYNITSISTPAVNNEALDLLRSDEEAFQDKVKHCVQSSRDHLYDKPAVDDDHYIVFEEYTPNIHNSVRTNMLQQGSDADRIVTVGHSWVKEGSFQPLSRNPSLQTNSDS